MRGRHTMAILKMMGVPETIAETIDDYVATAVRLANDVPWRQAIRNKIGASKQRVYRGSCRISSSGSRASRPPGRERRACRSSGAAKFNDPLIELGHSAPKRHSREGYHV